MSNKDSMSLEDMLLLDNQLCFPLYAAAKEVVRRYTPFLAPFNLTYTQYIAMMVLWEKKTVSVNELGKQLMLDSGTLTPLLRKLEDKKYLLREKSAKDGRRLIVSLTPEGASLKDKMVVVPQKMGTCAHLSPEETTELKRLLKKVTDNILASTDTSM
ncbi:MarR family winged helix-turn-helix transcriptional regulator [Lancefieldella rimae]|uniref:MarR family winged helix-turn-helix transcriptional regulator n=1 Tax=Lancefieldella rimae TaxID=1383 RepID=UPI003C6ECAC9